MGAPIAVGTCNWADHTDFYPHELEHGRRQREKLTYYAGYFPIVEIDTTFYGIPRPPVVEGWVARTPEAFRFNIKAFRSLTGHERENRRPRKPTADEERDFMAALAPLRQSGKLVAVHYQFPPWMTNRPEAREWLLEARDRHPGRSARRSSSGTARGTTATPGRRPRTCCASSSASTWASTRRRSAPARRRPLLAVTSQRLCITRFHGRNWRTWYKSGATSGDRFDYLYEPSELEEWVPAIRAASDDGVPVHVLLNNNRSNYAVVNAFDFGALLGLGLPRPPEPVIETLRQRDGHVPAWVDASPPAAAPTGRCRTAMRRRRHDGDQLTLSL